MNGKLLCQGVCLLLTFPWLVSAQSTFGSILGTVTDSSNAAIPGAKVVVTNVGENIPVNLVTNAQGNYEALNLKAGTYQVTMEASGFKLFKAAEVKLAARQVVRVNASLEVGAVTESVLVNGVAPVISTDTQTVDATLNTRGLLELPLNYRGTGSTSPYRALAYLPGVQSDDGFGLSVQGAIPIQTEVTLDGISTINVTGHSALQEVYPSAEGIAEMKVQGVGGNAEFGQVGDITTTSRGGSNDFHGSLFEYLQNAALDATPFGSTLKPQKAANTFGGSLGGRIIRNRLFFFGSFEQMEYRRGATLQATVPTAAMRAGDFSNEPVTLMDPFSGTPLPGNRIPDAQIVGPARKILDLYPNPNFGSGSVEAASNFRKNDASPIISRQFDIRVDNMLTSKQSLFGRLSWKNTSSISPTWQKLPADTSYNHARNVVLSHNYTFSPTLLNELRFGFTLSDGATEYHFDGRQITGGIGLENLPTLTFNGLPGINFSKGTSGFGKGKPGFSSSHLFQWTDNLTWVKNRHTLKFGGDVRRIRARSDLSFISTDNYGQFNFDGRYSGSDVADFMMGLPYYSGFASTNMDNDGGTWHYAVYAQDSFKATSNLTLEYGLRWEYHPAYKDVNGDITNFDRTVPRTGRVIIPSGPRALEITAPGFLQSINACPGPSWNGIACTPFLQADQVGWPDGLRFPHKRDFAPRFGFTYRPFGSTRNVISAGTGIYYTIPLGSVYYGLTGIHASDVRQFDNSVINGTPAFRLPQISPGGSGVKATALGNAYFGTSEQSNFRDPYAIQWHMTVERDLGWDTGLRITYIGMRYIEQPWGPDLNQPQSSTTPYAQRPQTDRPFPYWGRIYSYDTGSNSLVNSLQTEVNHRFRTGVSFNSAWTWTKALSDSGPAPTGFGGENSNGRVANSLDRRANRGNVAPTRRHRWITSAIYELPFGKGRRFMNNANPVLEGLAGGWRLSSILLLQTGPFLTATMSGGDPSGTNGSLRGTQRPDAVRTGNISNPTADRYWDRAAFVCPGRTPGAANQFDCNVAPIGRFGTAGVGTLLGPGTVNVSMGVAKDFRFKERYLLKLEGSFTNLPNHPNLANPGSNITSIAFGRTTSARGADSGGNRLGQLDLRLEF